METPSSIKAEMLTPIEGVSPSLALHAWPRPRPRPPLDPEDASEVTFWYGPGPLSRAALWTALPGHRWWKLAVALVMLALVQFAADIGHIVATGTSGDAGTQLAGWVLWGWGWYTSAKFALAAVWILLTGIGALTRAARRTAVR